MQEKIVPFIDSFGSKRLGVERTCPVCGILFICRKKVKRITCSNACRYRYVHLQKTTEVECANCKVIFRKHNGDLGSSKSGLYFCCRRCKDDAQKLGGIKEIMPPHYGTSTKVDYRKFFDVSNILCSRCGYKEFSCSVDIHHIDENRDNNDIENLITLCSNCHRSLHFNKWSLTDLSR